MLVMDLQKQFEEFIPQSTTIVLILVVLLSQTLFLNGLAWLINLLAWLPIVNTLLAGVFAFIESSLFWGTIIFTGLIVAILELNVKGKHTAQKAFGAVLLTVIFSFAVNFLSKIF